MKQSKLELSAASLTGIEIFSGLDARARGEVLALCRGQQYQPGELVVSHLDLSSDVFFIISGSVRVSIYSKPGKEISFRDLHAGQMFGELSAIDGQPRSAHVSALTAASIAFVSPDDFWELLQKYPDIARKTFKYLARLIRLLTDRVVEFSSLGVSNRIHAELLRLGLERGGEGNSAAIVPAPTHVEIASRVSTHREAVTREIGLLLRQGIVRKADNTLYITDMRSLQKLVDEVINEHKT